METPVQGLQQIVNQLQEEARRACLRAAWTSHGTLEGQNMIHHGDLQDAMNVGRVGRSSICERCREDGRDDRRSDSDTLIEERRDSQPLRIAWGESW